MNIDDVFEEAAALAKTHQLLGPVGNRVEELEGQVAKLTASNITLTGERDEARKYAVDSITNLPRDTVYYDRLEAAIKNYLVKKGWFAIAVTDTAGLKYVNDNHGRIKGDELIRTSGGILKTFPLTRRDLLARIGGDEFGLLLIGSKDQVKWRIDQLRRHIVERQNGINQRGYLPIELCMGVGIVTADYVDQKLQQDKSLAAEKIVGLLCDEGNRLANHDKEEQGIYSRYPKLQRYRATGGPSPGNLNQ